MSAIAGAYNLDERPIDLIALEQMGAILAHRGPDATGVWSSGSVGLAHRMLWTTPESLRERPPLVHKSGSLVVTADIRIDNRIDLIALLGFTDCASTEISDGQLLLSAYQRWGESCPERLIGDFAFAIWDERRQRLFCARDPMGVKPFYYYHHPGRVFVFASEIKAIFCLGEVPRRLNEVKVADHLALLFEDRSSTFYSDILRLPAAHSLIVDRDGLRMQRYWALDRSREVRLGSDQEYADAFREVFTEAVRCRLRSAFPVGSTLSGGLDSSSIACVARQALTEEGKASLHTLSAIFPNLPDADLRKIDERKYVDAVLALGGFEPHYVEADRVSPLVDVDNILWHTDEPMNAPNLYIHVELYRLARQNGIRVFLDGLDGDSTVSHGVGYLAELAWTGRWKTLVSEAMALSRMSPNSAFTPRRIIWEYGLRPLVPESAVQLWRLLRRRPEPTVLVDPIVNPAFVNRLRLVERAHALRRLDSSLPRNSREGHWRALTSALYPYVLEIADKASAAFSLESRYPFFDRRLMEFCLALPSEQKLDHGWTRIILRRATTGILPPEVQWRIDKANLSPSFQRRLLASEGAMLERLILSDSAIFEQYVDIPTLQAAFRRYASEPLRNAQDSLTIYRVVTLALWLRNSGLNL